MTKPGDGIRKFAERVCSPNTMERLVEPIVSDLQTEHAGAVAEGRHWRARRIQVEGYIAFGKAFILYGSESMMAIRRWTEGERRGLIGTARAGLTTMIVAGLVLSLLPLAQRVSLTSPRALVYLIPQALPLAIAIGIAAGVLFGLRRGPVTRRLSVAVALLSVLCSVVSFIVLNEVVPASNQAFREMVFEGRDFRPVGKGLNEMTLGELRRQMSGERVPDFGFAVDTNAASITYHFRWALPFASFALAMFGLSMVRLRSLRWWAALLLAIGACAGYYELLYVARELGLDGRLPPIASAWLANIALALVAGFVLLVWRPRSSSTYRGEPTTS